MCVAFLIVMSSGSLHLALTCRFSSLSQPDHSQRRSGIGASSFLRPLGMIFATFDCRTSSNLKTLSLPNGNNRLEERMSRAIWS